MVIGGAIGARVCGTRRDDTDAGTCGNSAQFLLGLAAVLVGFASFFDPDINLYGAEATIHNVEIYLGILIGAVTFTGSVIAFGKLSGRVGSKPLLLPARHLLNLGPAGTVDSAGLVVPERRP